MSDFWLFRFPHILLDLVARSAHRALEGGDFAGDPALVAYLTDQVRDPGYRPCLCMGLSHPHRPGSGACRLRGTILARELNRMRPPRDRARDRVCWCGAYDFPHRVGSGRCNRHPDNPVSQARGEAGACSATL